MNRSREISINELIYYVLRKWRVLITAGVTAAFVVGGGRLILGRNGVLSGTITGALVAVIVAAVYFMAEGVLSRKMWSKSAWFSFAIPVIDSVCIEKEALEGERIDRRIDEIMGYPAHYLSLSAAGEFAARNTAEMLRYKGSARAAIISTADERMCREFTAGMNSAQSGTFSFAGNVLKYPRLLDIIKGKELVLLAESEKMTVNDVKKLIEILNAHGKKLLGVILIK